MWTLWLYCRWQALSSSSLSSPAWLLVGQLTSNSLCSSGVPLASTQLHLATQTSGTSALCGSSGTIESILLHVGGPVFPGQLMCSCCVYIENFCMHYSYNKTSFLQWWNFESTQMLHVQMLYVQMLHVHSFVHHSKAEVCLPLKLVWSSFCLSAPSTVTYGQKLAYQCVVVSWLHCVPTLLGMFYVEKCIVLYDMYLACNVPRIS